MKGKFCPKCGATNKPFYRGFCIDCYIKDHPKLLQADDITLKRCQKCLRVLSRGEWVSGSPESVGKIVASKVKTQLKEPKVSVRLLESGTKGDIYEVAATGRLGSEPVALTREVKVSYQKGICDVCSRKSGNYYEVLVQLRPAGEEADLGRMKSVLVFLRNESRSLTKKDRNAEVFRYSFVKDGIDVFFGSLRVAKIALQHMQATYHPKVKESYTLTGVDHASGKRRYRVTFSVRV